MPELVGLAVLAGLNAGSFLNVCIRRWPLGLSVVRPGSHCPACGYSLAWRDKIPVLSFFVLQGRCRNCQVPISWRYPLVEGLTALLYGGIAIQFGASPEAGKQVVFASMMLVLLFTDVDHRVLPDRVTMGGLALGLAVSPFVVLPAGPVNLVKGLGSINGNGPSWGVSLAESVLAATVFGGFLWIVGESYYRIRGVEGLGLGDVKMIAMIGAFQGTAATVLILVIGCWLATLGGILAIVLFGKTRNYRIPLGAYFAVSALIVLFAGSTILDLYWDLILI